MFKHKLALLLLLAGLLCVPASAPATIAFVNSATGTNGLAGSATTIATAPPTNHTAGNLLVAGVEWDDAGGGGVLSSLSDTAGNTYSIISGSLVTNGTTHLQIAYAKNITGNASNVVAATFSAPSQFRRIIVHQYSGADTTNPFDVAAVGTGTGTALSTSAVTTNFANEVLVVFGSNNDGSTTIFTAGPGFAILSQISNDAGSEDRIVSATGSYSGAMSTAGSFVWRCSMATFKEAPRGGGGGVGPTKIPAPDLTRHNLKRLDTLCQIVDCPCSDPVIKAVDYPIGPVMPGFPVGLKGCGFGNNPDPNVFRVVLTIQDSNGAEYDDQLTTDQLRDDLAVATIPDDDITGWGVMDQTVCLRVERVINGRLRKTPCFSIAFQALRDIELLPGSDAAVKLQAGGDYGGGPSGDNPLCYPWPPHQLGCVYSTAPNETFHCSRFNYAGPCADIYGTEIHEIGPLINDWVFTQFTFDKSIINGELEVRDPDPPFSTVEGTASPPWNPHISWWVTQNDTAWYVGKVYIEGPCGVPWRPGGYFGPCR